MCRNIKLLFNFEPPTTDDEIRAAAIQYVRKVTGSTRPAAANQAAFDDAVDEIARATARALDRMVAKGPPHSREREAEKAKQRAQKRYGVLPTSKAPFTG